MALIGNINTKYNVDSNYHIITNFKWDKFSDISFTVKSYLDQDSRNQNKNCLVENIFSIPNDPVLTTMTIEDLYNKLKCFSDFSKMKDG